MNSFANIFHLLNVLWFVSDENLNDSRRPSLNSTKSSNSLHSATSGLANSALGNLASGDQLSPTQSQSVNPLAALAAFTANHAYATAGISQQALDQIANFEQMCRDFNARQEFGSFDANSNCNHTSMCEPNCDRLHGLASRNRVNYLTESDSDEWSEPDLNVSRARIAIEDGLVIRPPVVKPMPINRPPKRRASGNLLIINWINANPD